MLYRKLSTGLGYFSLALGAAELIAGKRIARGLGARGGSGVVKAFGGREIAAGIGLLQAPAHSVRMWTRVAGDVLDLAALGLVARRAGLSKPLLGSLAFVGGALALDALVARGLDRSTGKTLPRRSTAQAA